MTDGPTRELTRRCAEIAYWLGAFKANGDNFEYAEIARYLRISRPTVRQKVKMIAGWFPHYGEAEPAEHVRWWLALELIERRRGSPRPWQPLSVDEILEASRQSEARYKAGVYDVPAIAPAPIPLDA